MLRSSLGHEVAVLTPWLASLYFPYRNQKSLTEWRRRADQYHLTVTPGADTGGLPYGVLPRVILPYLLSVAVKAESNVIDAGPTFSGFLSAIGQPANSGGSGPNSPRNRLREQLPRVLFAHFMISDYTNPDRDRSRAVIIGEELNVWWAKEPSEPGRPAITRSDSWIVLNQSFFNELMASQVRLHLPTIRKLSDKNPMKVDVYTFAASQAPQVEDEILFRWPDLFQRFGGTISDDPERRRRALSDFKLAFIKYLKEVRSHYSALNVEPLKEGLLLRHSDPHVDPEGIVVPVNFPGSSATRAKRLTVPAQDTTLVQGELLDKEYMPVQPARKAVPRKAARPKTTTAPTPAPGLITTTAPVQSRRTG